MIAAIGPATNDTPGTERPRRAGSSARCRGWTLLLCALLGQAAFSQPAPVDSPAASPPSSAPHDLTVYGQYVYFTADDGIHGRELWRCDDRGECRMAHEFTPGPQGSEPITCGLSGSVLLVMARNGQGGVDLWRWNDQEGEPALLFSSPLEAAWCAPLIHSGVKPGGKVYFTLRDESKAWNMWALFPGETKLRKFTDLPVVNTTGPAPSGFAMPDGTDLFLADEYLWRSDGTPKGTVKVVKSGHGKVAAIDWVATVGQNVLLTLRDDEHGLEPWVTDGTPEGTALLRDICPGPDASTSGQLGSMNDRVYFGANDNEHGLELWVTDATEAGTVLLKDINPGRGSSDPHYFMQAGNLLYFSADNGLQGGELWCTDGTAEGTRLVKDVNPSLASSTPYHPALLGDRVCFCATTALHGDTIWSSDGTEQGTSILVDIMPGPGLGGPDNLTPFHGKLLFTYDEPVHGEEPWIAELPSGKAHLAADINVPRFNPSTSPSSLTTVGDKVFFVAPDLGHGKELWVSDGSEANTRRLTDIAPGPADTDPRELTRADGLLFFTAPAPGQGRELWRSDGTPEGTSLVLDIRAGSQGSEPRNLLWADGVLYFTAADQSHGREVWASDGTPAGTRLAAEFIPRGGGPSFVRLVAFAGQAYCYTKNGTGGGVSLYRIGRAFAAPMHVLDLPHEAPSPSLDELIAHSAPPETLVPWVYPCSDCDEATPLTVEGITYFVAHTVRYGAELWRTDGTIPGTRLVCDAFPGRAGSGPKHLASWHGRIYFVGDHPNFGQVLWSTDGTPLGTEVVRPPAGSAHLPPVPAVNLVAMEDALVLVTGEPANQPDILGDVGLSYLRIDKGLEGFSKIKSAPAGRDGKRPAQIVSTGKQVFFTADDGTRGVELWTLDREKQAFLVKDILVPGNLVPLRR